MFEKMPTSRVRNGTLNNFPNCERSLIAIGVSELASARFDDLFTPLVRDREATRIGKGRVTRAGIGGRAGVVIRSS